MTPRHVAAALLVLAAAVLPAARAQLAVRGETVHTMAGAPITDGVVLVGRDGKIERVGSASQVIVPAGYRTLTAKVVTPGLIDAHTVVGLSGYLNQPQDQNQLEPSAPIQPELRALDAYNPRERLVEWLRSFGVTTLHTGHAPGALVSGQTMIVKTRGDTVEKAVVVPAAMIAVTLGDGGTRQGGSPGTRSKMVAMLRAELIKAQDYVAKRSSPPAATGKPGAPTAPTSVGGGAPSAGTVPPGARKPVAGTSGGPAAVARPTEPAATGRTPDSQAAAATTVTGQGAPAPATATATPTTRDLRMDEMARVLKREIPLLITAHRATDIASALRLAKEFNVKIVLDGASEAYLMTTEIKAAGVPVIVHPTLFRADGETENLSMETASLLRGAGIPVALQSSFEGYVPKTRVVLFEAAVAAAHGLSFPEALDTITLAAAKILGIDKRVGSLEPGKDADLALFDGDPFEYTTHCVGTVIDGQVASEERR